MTEEHANVLHELFGENLGEGSYIAAPMNGAALDYLKIGRNVYINTNCLAMARGGITIEDDVLIAANALHSDFCTLNGEIAGQTFSHKPHSTHFLSSIFG